MNVVGITSLQVSPSVQSIPSEASSDDATANQQRSTDSGSVQAATPQQNVQNVNKIEGTSHSRDLQKTIDKVNHVLSASNTRVEMDSKAPANELWLNVVDKTTGQVIQKFPAEALREFSKSANIKGLALDIHG